MKIENLINLENNLKSFKNLEKKNQVIFLNPMNDERQNLIFEDLLNELPEFNFIQPMKYSTNEFFNLLGSSRLLFSVNLEEDQSLFLYEGIMSNCFPFIPDINKYIMFPDEMKYSKRLVLNFEEYLQHREILKIQIKAIMDMDQLALDAYCQSAIKKCLNYFKNK